MKRWYEMTLEERQKAAYQGLYVWGFISDIFDANNIEIAQKHAQTLSDMGYLEANGALAFNLTHHEEPHELASADLVFQLRKSHAESNRPKADESAFDIAIDISGDGDCDSPEAMKWVRRAAELGNEEAAQALGNFLTTVGSSPANVLEGIKWYFKSLSMEPVEGWYFDHEDDPIERDVGWRDWDFLGRLINEHPTEVAIEIVRLVKTEQQSYLARVLGRANEQA